MSQLSHWLEASRPKTLWASIVPVCVGSALAKDHFSAGLFGLILIDAVLLQVASNFANDVSDYERGADTAERVGPRRAVAAGLITPEEMKRATKLILFAAMLIGFYLVIIGGLPILLIGLAAMGSAILYTDGPYPLAYNGLGEAFVILFFGIIAVSGTYYLFTLALSFQAVFAGLAVGSISTAILVVNNLRDIEEDQKNGKRTLAVRFGKQFARTEYSACLLLAATIPLVAFYLPTRSLLMLLPALFVIPAIRVNRVVWHTSSAQELNQALSATGKLLALYGLLFCFALVWGSA